MNKKLRLTSYGEFVQRVRRHAPSVLLTELGRHTSVQKIWSVQAFDPDLMIHPWMAAVIARESITASNEHRSRNPVMFADLARIRNAYMNLDEPLFRRSVGEAGALESSIIRYAFEQAPFQHPRRGDLLRVVALLDQDHGETPLLSAESWRKVLGTELVTFLRAGFLIATTAEDNEGRFSPAMWNAPWQQEILSAVGVAGADVATVFTKSFAASVDDIKQKALATQNTDPLLRRWDLNPLRATPFVRLTDGGYVAPCLQLASQKLSPASLYYAAMAVHGPAFSRQLGQATEDYVGRLFAHVGAERVFGEIEYSKGAKSADFILCFPDLTVIVEVKSARVAQPGRLGLDGYIADFTADVGKAMKQLRRTKGLIEANHPAFADVTRTGDLRGVVVTAEPHYMINEREFRVHMDDPGMPTVVLSLEELEYAVAAAHAGRPGQLFAALAGRALEDISIERLVIAHTESLGLNNGDASHPVLDEVYGRVFGGLTALRDDLRTTGA